MVHAKLVAALVLAGVLIVSIVGLSSIASQRPRAALSEPQPYAGTVPPDLPLGADTDIEALPNPVVTR